MSLSRLKKINFDKRVLKCITQNGGEIELVALKHNKVSEFEILIPQDCMITYTYSKKNIFKRIFSGKNSRYCISLNCLRNGNRQVIDKDRLKYYEDENKAKELFKLIAASSYHIEIYLDKKFKLTNVYYEYYSAFPRDFWEESIHLFDEEFPFKTFVASMHYN